jgi:hypothetical protein
MNLNEVEDRQRAGPIDSAVHETNDPIRPVRGVFRRILVGKLRKIDIRLLSPPGARDSRLAAHAENRLAVRNSSRSNLGTVRKQRCVGGSTKGSAARS